MAAPLTLSGPSTRGRPAFVLGGRFSIDAMGLSPLERLRGCERERVCDAALSQRNLEGVFALRLCSVKSCFGCLTENPLVGCFPMQDSLRLQRAPGLGAYTAQGYTDEVQLATVDHGHNGGRREGKFIGSTVAQLEVDLLAAG